MIFRIKIFGIFRFPNKKIFKFFFINSSSISKKINIFFKMSTKIQKSYIFCTWFRQFSYFESFKKQVSTPAMLCKTDCIDGDVNTFSNWTGYAVGDVKIVTLTDGDGIQIEFETEGYKLNWRRIPLDVYYDYVYYDYENQINDYGTVWFPAEELYGIQSDFL